MNKYNNLERRLSDQRSKDLYRRDILSSPESLADFRSNDYLGLRNSLAVSEAISSYSISNGFGAGASRLLGGTFPVTHQFEESLAAFHGQEKALLFSSGFAANLGAISCICNPDWMVFSHQDNHASIIDGIRLAGARKTIFAGPDELREKISSFRQKHTHGPILIAFESIFSISGKIAPVDDYLDISSEFEAISYVDEAHAVGVVGENGAGLSRNAVVKPDILLGTLGKSFGLQGAYIASRESIRNYLVNFCRSYIYSTGLSPAIAAGGLVALEIVRSETGELSRKKLRDNISMLLNRASPGENAKSPIFTRPCSDVVVQSQKAEKHGLLLSAIRPPTATEECLRATVSASHTNEEIERLRSYFGDPTFHVEPPRPL